MSDIKPSARRKARRFAMQGLYQWQMTGTPVIEIEKQFLEENDMKKVDMVFFRELLRGVTTSLDTIEEHIGKYLDRKLEELDPVTEAILRISVFELIQRVDIPYRVVINEGVELAKDFGSEDSHRYVNGILDKLAQDLRAVEINAR
jgi:transcription antitermination protein NusB